MCNGTHNASFEEKCCAQLRGGSLVSRVDRWRKGRWFLQ